MVGACRRFALTNTAQQAVGGLLLMGLFVAVEEVWVLARSMSLTQALLTLTIVLAVGYDVLYKADGRDPDKKREVGGIPIQFTSLISVSYLSVSILALTFGVPGTFPSDVSEEVLVSVLGYEFDLAVLHVTFKATSVGAVLNVIGVAMADLLF